MFCSTFCYVWKLGLLKKIWDISLWLKIIIFKEIIINFLKNLTQKFVLFLNSKIQSGMFFLENIYPCYIWNMCRDCEQAENWMSNRESFLQADEVDSKEEKIEMMIKKHEDFDKAIGNQEEKIEALQTYADQLVQSEHYAGPNIEDKKKEVGFHVLKSLRHFSIFSPKYNFIIFNIISYPN